jgi:hypothetical protein
VQLRRATLVLDINCAAVDDVEPQLFTVQAQVEKAVAANPTLGGVVRELALTSSRQDEIDGDDAEYISSAERSYSTLWRSLGQPARTWSFD